MKEFINLFPLDSYDTPEESKRGWMDKLVLGNRFHFFLRNYLIFMKTGICARRGKLDQERQIYFSNQNIRLVEAVGGKIHLRGLDHLRALEGRSVILMGNHMSSLETAVFHAIVRPYLDFTFVIKESLLSVPFFGDVMRALEAIPVGRNNPRDDFKTVLTKGKELLGRGKSIILFPQATRSAVFEEANFNSIGIKLARAAGVEVVPFVLKTDFIGEGPGCFKDFGKIHREREIHFDFFPAMPITGTGREEHQKIIELTVNRLKEWGVE